MLLPFDSYRVLSFSLLLVCLITPLEAQRAVDYLKRPIDKARQNVEKYNSSRDLSEIVDSGEESKPVESTPKATGAVDVESQFPVTDAGIGPDESSDVVEAEEAPLPSDASSLRLIENFATVIGAKAKRGIRNVAAKGTFRYGKNVKEFELVETSQGERCLTLEWRYMGRTFRERNISISSGSDDANDGSLSREISKKVFAANGDVSWERVFAEVIRGGQLVHRFQFGTTVVSHGRKLPGKPLLGEERAVIAGGYGEVSPNHFQNVFLLLQPILRSSERQMGFAYMGQEELMRRTMYVVRHQSKRVFYFDADKFLLVQWGGQSRLAGQTLLVDYRSTAFKRWSSVLFPSKVDMVAEDQVLGTYAIETIDVDAKLAADFFILPQL